MKEKFCLNLLTPKDTFWAKSSSVSIMLRMQRKITFTHVSYNYLVERMKTVWSKFVIWSRFTINISNPSIPEFSVLTLILFHLGNASRQFRVLRLKFYSLYFPLWAIYSNLPKRSKRMHSMPCLSFHWWATKVNQRLNQHIIKSTWRYYHSWVTRSMEIHFRRLSNQDFTYKNLDIFWDCWTHCFLIRKLKVYFWL